jgi:predicted P-loop ATPase
MENYMNEAATLVAANPNLMQIEEFFEQNYLFRNNVLNGRYEVACIGSNPLVWQHLTNERWNSIVWNLEMALPDVKSIKNYAELYVYSEHTPLFDPIKNYLEHLPSWDGKDHVGRLINCLAGVNEKQKEWLRIWLRSMVTHWLKIEVEHANDVVLLLMGDQGCGKSTFCQRILPKNLREYYLDHLNLGNKFDKEMALTHNLLVNIDEFDQVKNSQQAELKHTISKTKVNGRRIYASVQTDQHRYASFVATTNSRQPLKDPTGSRRYLCIDIKKNELIDNTLDIDYAQFYAQILSEIKSGKCCYFNREETILLQEANQPYQQIADFATMTQACFRKPKKTEQITPTIATDILEELLCHYPQILHTQKNKIAIAVALKSLGYKSTHTHKGSAYYVVPIKIKAA